MKNNRFTAFIKTLPAHVKVQLWMLLVFPINLILILWAKNSPDSVEALFQSGVLKAVPRALSKITGVLPFSLAELLTVGVFACVTVWIVCFVTRIVRAAKQKSGALALTVDFLSRILALALCAVLVFNLLYGLAYYRKNTTASVYAHYVSYETRDIALVGMLLAEETKKARQAVTDSDGEPFSLNMTDSELYEAVKAAYRKLGEEYPVYAGDYADPKPVMLSKPWTYTFVMGIYMPFTGEANYNTNIPDVEIPHTILHEMAHQRAVAAEDEANFAAFLASRMSDDARVRYSGLFESFCYVLSSLKRSDEELYGMLLDAAGDGVKTDIEHVDAFWKSYETPIARLSGKLNDAYLESNGQEFGTASYSLTVQYILDYYVNNYLSNYIS